MDNLQPLPRECEQFLNGLDFNKVPVDEDAFKHSHWLGIDLIPDAFKGAVDLDLPASLACTSEDEDLELEPDMLGA